MPLSWVKVKFADFRSQVLGELATELEAEVSEDLVEALAAATSLVAFADGVLEPGGARRAPVRVRGGGPAHRARPRRPVRRFRRLCRAVRGGREGGRGRSADGSRRLRRHARARPARRAFGPRGREQRRRAVAGGGKGRDAAVRSARCSSSPKSASRSSGARTRTTTRTRKSTRTIATSEVTPRGFDAQPTVHGARSKACSRASNAAQGCMRDSLSATRVGSGRR